ncbi:MAG: hypothetical protein WBB27_05520 [Maribacter sp.]
MSSENIIIIMLCYVILCIAIFLFASKYWSKRKSNESIKEDKKSILDELEMETNIFEFSSTPDTELNKFEIDSPYKEKSINEFTDIKDDDNIDDQIEK